VDRDYVKKLFKSAILSGFEKNLGYVTIGNIVNIVLGAVLWFFIASQLNAVEFGSLNYDISIATLLSSLGIMGFDTTLTAYVAKGVNKMIYESAFLLLVSSGIIAVVLVILYPSIPVILLVVSMIFFTLIEAENLGKHLFKRYMWIMIFQRVIALVSIPLLSQLIGVEGALYGFALSYWSVSFDFFRYLRNIKVSISTILPIKKYFFHSYMLGISKLLPYFWDKIIILPFFGFAMVGYYQFGVQILTIVSILSFILYGYILPHEAKAKGGSTLKKFTLLGFFLAVILVAILIMLVPYAVTALFPNFITTIPSVQIILLAGIPLTITAIYNSVHMAHGSSKYPVIGTIWYLSCQTAGIIILGELWGVIGLSLATTIASTVQCVYLVLNEYRIRTSPQRG
jgi:O-antigen/teichoic acid export membrane protein